MARTTWSEAQIERFASDIQKQYGSHWAYIPEPMREPLVSHYVLGVVTGLDRESIAPEDIAELARRLRVKVLGDEKI